MGSYTEGKKSEGIFVYEFNPNNGKLKEVEREGNLINPSFITLSPNGKYLYACTESKLEINGSVTAFEIDTLTGNINFLNKKTTGGRNPVFLIVDKNNEYVINANYTDAGISVYKLKKDGSLNPFSTLLVFERRSIIPGRQDESHIHSVNFSPDNRYILAPDLGADKIRVLSFSQEGVLTVIDSLTIDTKAGSGPRHFTFHPNNVFAYCMEELSGTVTSYNYQNGQLKWVDSDFSYSKEQETYKSADIHISPDGRFLYASNRWKNENTISIFSIQQTKGTLSLVGHQSTFGDIPRSFVIDPSGQFLIVANQVTGLIVVFKRDLETGLLTKTNTEIRIDLPSSLKMRTYSSQSSRRP